MAVRLQHSPDALLQSMTAWLAGGGETEQRYQEQAAQQNAEFRTRQNESIFGGLGRGISEAFNTRRQEGREDELRAQDFSNLQSVERERLGGRQRIADQRVQQRRMEAFQKQFGVAPGAMLQSVPLNLGSEPTSSPMSAPSELGKMPIPVFNPGMTQAYRKVEERKNKLQAEGDLVLLDPNLSEHEKQVALNAYAERIEPLTEWLKGNQPPDDRPKYTDVQTGQVTPVGMGSGTDTDGYKWSLDKDGAPASKAPTKRYESNAATEKWQQLAPEQRIESFKLHFPQYDAMVAEDYKFYRESGTGELKFIEPPDAGKESDIVGDVMDVLLKQKDAAQDSQLLSLLKTEGVEGVQARISSVLEVAAGAKRQVKRMAREAQFVEHYRNAPDFQTVYMDLLKQKPQMQQLDAIAASMPQTATQLHQKRGAAKRLLQELLAIETSIVQLDIGIQRDYERMIAQLRQMASELVIETPFVVDEPAIP